MTSSSTRMTRAAQALLEIQVKRDVTFDPRHEAFSDLVHQIAAAARRTDVWNSGYELAIATDLNARCDSG